MKPGAGQETRQAGFDPVRRNRNIGTAKQGHGKNNRLVIPAICSGEKDWAETLHAHTMSVRRVRSRDVTFIVEHCRTGHAHACTVADIIHVLTHIPVEDWRGIYTIILRQPTRKQVLLRPAWGRIYYSATLGLPAKKALRTGPVIALEAVNCDAVVKWQKSLQPADLLELERLREDGHDIKQDCRHHIITLNRASVRACQLYRTLLHEVGHWVHFRTSTQKLADEHDLDEKEIFARYFACPAREREAFAHRYASSTQAFLRKFGVIPFDPL